MFNATYLVNFYIILQESHLFLKIYIMYLLRKNGKAKVSLEIVTHWR